MNVFNIELNKLKKLTNELAKNGYLVDRAAQWEFAFDAVPDLVVIVNPDFKIKFINKAFALRLGVKCDERYTLIDKYCYEVTMAENCKTVDQRICKDAGEKCLVSDKKCNMTVFEGVWIKDGWFEFTHSPIYDEENNLLGFICILRDVTEHIVLKQELQGLKEKMVY